MLLNNEKEKEMKIGATKITEITETKRLFNAAQAAILMLVGKFATNAIEAGNRAVLVEFGRNVNQLLNNALESLDPKHDENATQH